MVASEISVLTASYDNEKLLCNTSHAITQIKKIQVDGPFGKDYHFEISCLPLNICNEVRFA